MSNFILPLTVSHGTKLPENQQQPSQLTSQEASFPSLSETKSELRSH